MFPINDPILTLEVTNMLKCVRERGVRECLGITDDVVDRLLTGDESVINELKSRNRILARVDDEFRNRTNTSFFTLLAEIDKKIRDINIPKERARVALCVLIKSLGYVDADCSMIPTEIFDAFECIKYEKEEIIADSKCLENVANSSENGRKAVQAISQMLLFYTLAKGQLANLMG